MRSKVGDAASIARGARCEGTGGVVYAQRAPLAQAGVAKVGHGRW